MLSIEGLKQWSGYADDNECYELLYRMQEIGWLEGITKKQQAPAGTLENIVQQFLPSLSSSDKALLADGQGFYVATHGFAHETAEELSALSADIASLHDRHMGLLRNNLGMRTDAWALIDAGGNSQVGFWPLFVGDQRFVLVIGGMPYFNHQSLTSIVWSLSVRYGHDATQ